MKKIYIIPSQRVAEIELDSLVAASPTSFTLDDEVEVSSEEDVMTKRQNLWDSLW